MFEKRRIFFSNVKIIEISDSCALATFQPVRNSINCYVKMNANTTLNRGRTYAIFRLKTLRNSGLGLNQRTNGPENAHLISWPSKAQNIQNLEKIW